MLREHLLKLTQSVMVFASTADSINTSTDTSSQQRLTRGSQDFTDVTGFSQFSSSRQSPKKSSQFTNSKDVRSNNRRKLPHSLVDVTLKLRNFRNINSWNHVKNVSTEVNNTGRNSKSNLCNVTCSITCIKTFVPREELFFRLLRLFGLCRLSTCRRCNRLLSLLYRSRQLSKPGCIIL